MEADIYAMIMAIIRAQLGLQRQSSVHTSLSYSTISFYEYKMTSCADKNVNHWACHKNFVAGFFNSAGPT
jgi:hypothetical protein